MRERSGIYIASRSSLAERVARWKHLRDVEGWHIISSWIDEAGEATDLGALWVRIEAEVKSAERLIFYAEEDDFPVKGAYIEAAFAIAAGIPVFVVTPGVIIEPRSFRPVGSWVNHPLVQIVPSIELALVGAAKRSARPNANPVNESAMSTGRKHKLTPSQFAMLSNLAAGRSWDSHLSGRSAYGGAMGTVQKLRMLGYMSGNSITDAGRNALNKIKGKQAIK